MPTVSVQRDLLFERIGRTFTDSSFDELCFQFGIELDEVLEESNQPVVYKIEIPANRYDMLSLEGISRALAVFLETKATPKYQVCVPEKKIRLEVSPSVKSVRPVVVAAVLRGIKFTETSYQSFIDLQEKIHGGIGRRRQIVSMGTHDLDTVKGPTFKYEALDPASFSFIPLNQKECVDGRGMVKLYDSDIKIKKFLPLIRDSPLFPVIRDSTNLIMSVPPIINSDHSKIRLETKNVFIEVTGTDRTKAMIALNTICTDFAEYCEAVEAVEVVYESGTSLTPEFDSRTLTVSMPYINKAIGIAISPEEASRLLSRMCLQAKVGKEDLHVTVPVFRSDIFHACDVMEDVAIAYGFNNIPKALPPTTSVGSVLPINQLSDALRLEVALAGFTEVLTLTLCSRAENFTLLRLEDDPQGAVALSNPKTAEYQVVHTSLIPELLKTLACNKHMPLPLRLFTVADVCLIDESGDTGARNERRLCALFAGQQGSGFELIHGLLDRLMAMLDVKPDGYRIQPSSIPTFFEGRQAEVIYNGKKVGAFGIVHPEVLKGFEVPWVVGSVLELCVEAFL